MGCMKKCSWNVIKSSSVYVNIYFFHMYQPQLLFKSIHVIWICVHVSVLWMCVWISVCIQNFINCKKKPEKRYWIHMYTYWEYTPKDIEYMSQNFKQRFTTTDLECWANEFFFLETSLVMATYIHMSKKIYREGPQNKHIFTLILCINNINNIKINYLRPVNCPFHKNFACKICRNSTTALTLNLTVRRFLLFQLDASIYNIHKRSCKMGL